VSGSSSLPSTILREDKKGNSYSGTSESFWWVCQDVSNWLQMSDQTKAVLVYRLQTKKIVTPRCLILLQAQKKTINPSKPTDVVI
jgi:hypothetical protein